MNIDLDALITELGYTCVVQTVNSLNDDKIASYFDVYVDFSKIGMDKFDDDLLSELLVEDEFKVVSKTTTKSHSVAVLKYFNKDIVNIIATTHSWTGSYSSSINKKEYLYSLTPRKKSLISKLSNNRFLEIGKKRYNIFGVQVA